MEILNAKRIAKSTGGVIGTTNILVNSGAKYLLLCQWEGGAGNFAIYYVSYYNGVASLIAGYNPDNVNWTVVINESTTSIDITNNTQSKYSSYILLMIN